MNEPSHDQCTALNQLASAVLVLDQQNQVLFANEAFGHWSGLGIRRAKWMNWELVDVSGRLRSALSGADNESLRTIRDLDCLFQSELRRADVVMKSPVFDRDWRLLEFHPQAESAQDEKIALSVLEAIRGLAHEIKNPLAGLQGAAQLLERRIQDDAAQSCLQVIRNEVNRLTSLTNRLLHPEQIAPHVRVNVHEVLERVRVLAQAEAEWVANIVRDYDPSLPEVMGDADRLIQAIWNLVRNAIEAGPSEIRFRTRLEWAVPLDAHQIRAAVRVDVMDNGRGVDNDMRERIFLPLVTGRGDGTGLGLPITQAIAREHGGVVSFQSRPGHTVFTLLLPMAESDSALSHELHSIESKKDA